MLFKLMRYYSVEVKPEGELSSTFSGFITELELTAAEAAQLSSEIMRAKLDKSHDEDVILIRENMRFFFGEADVTIVEVSHAEYQTLFNFANKEGAHLTLEMREGILCIPERLM